MKALTKANMGAYTKGFFTAFLLALRPMTRYIPLFLLFVMLAACKPETYTPKPRGYYKVSLPKHEYRVFAQQGYPYTFEYPVYADIIKDTSFFDSHPENPYWINLDFPSIGARIYLSYKEISAKQPLEKLLEDAHRMLNYHDRRADFIDPHAFDNGDGVGGLLFELGGDAASAYQFIAFDSTKHYLRGALYFDVTPNADSLKPMNEFIREDMIHLTKTLMWR